MDTNVERRKSKMKNLNKITSLLICLVLILSLCACGVKPDKNGIIKLGADEFSSSGSSVYLYDKSTTDISALKYCSELEYLDIRECNIEDLSPLLECPKLQRLIINGYTFSKNFAVINSISSLKDLSVIIQENDIVPSEKITLENIDLLEISNQSPNPIDLAIFDMPQLCSLSIYSNVIENISAVGNLENLESLSISCDALISDIPFPSSLKSLYLYRYDLTGIENLPNLEHLYIGNIQGVALDNLRSAKSLKTLVIWDGEINDISPLAELQELEILIIDGRANVDDLSPLAKLSKLRELTVRGSFEDISAVAELKELEYLQLTGNFTDVSAVADLNRVGSAIILSFELNDITPLLKDVSFAFLEIRKNNVPKEQFERFAELNPDCQLSIRTD